MSTIIGLTPEETSRLLCTSAHLYIDRNLNVHPPCLTNLFFLLKWAWESNLRSGNFTLASYPGSLGRGRGKKNLVLTPIAHALNYDKCFVVMTLVSLCRVHDDVARRRQWTMSSVATDVYHQKTELQPESSLERLGKKILSLHYHYGRFCHLSRMVGPRSAKTCLISLRCLTRAGCSDFKVNPSTQLSWGHKRTSAPSWFQP